MVSELDWEYLQVMRNIEEKEDASASQPEQPVQPGNSSLRANLPGGRILLLIIISVLIIALLYTAYLAGIFGTTGGQRGIWRRAYRNQTDYLEKENSNLFVMLVAAREERDGWEALAREHLADLSECRSELSSAQGIAQRWETRYWRTELSLNGTLGELRRVEMESNEWEDMYASTLGELRSLEDEHARLTDELSSTRSDLEEARRDKAVIQAELRDRSLDLVKLQVAVGLLHLELGRKDGEVDRLVQRFHELELEHRDLLCELRFCESENARWEELVEELHGEIEARVEEIEACRNRMERVLLAMENTRMENEELRSLYESMLVRVEGIVRERDRVLLAYRVLSHNHTLLLEELGNLEEYCANLTELLIELESERDHWLLLYQQASTQLSLCLGQLDYWRGMYESILLQLEDALAEIQLLSGQLDNCTQSAEEWMNLYQSIQLQLLEALSEVEYWRGLYMDLANITVDVGIDNLVVLERIDGKPSVVSADITVCVSTVETPMLLLLEFWGEPIDCVWGYGSIVEDVSGWPGNCKVFSVTMDFGIGVPPYHIVAKTTLMPIDGQDLTEVEGPP